MRRLIVVFAFSLLAPIPAQGISRGEVDTEHTNVGALAIEFEPGAYFINCSGTLIAPDVFLVAGHCVAGFAAEQFPANQVMVTFDLAPFESATFIRASAYYAHPDFGATKQDPHDLGVVILAEPVTQWHGVAVHPASLPTAGLLDALSAHGGLNDTSFVNVGYGYGVIETGHGKPQFVFDGVREFSMSPFKELHDIWLDQLMNSNATGEGGVCFIDSGGPKFLPGTNTTVAVESGGDRHCYVISRAYRLDIPQARDFLGQFVVLP